MLIILLQHLFDAFDSDNAWHGTDHLFCGDKYHRGFAIHTHLVEHIHRTERQCNRAPFILICSLAERRNGKCLGFHQLHASAFFSLSCWLPSDRIL